MESAMTFKTIFTAAVLALALPVMPASAACFGSGAFKTCSDSSGNNYTVNKFGNTTTVTGSNARTGSNWNQTTTTFGSNSYTNGTTNGRSWNQTTTPYGSFGTDSRGNSFSNFGYGN